MRTLATFEVECADDSLWDDNDNLVMPRGRILAEGLSDKLRERGFISSPVVQHSFYGWHFDLNRNHESVQLILQGGQPWILVADETQRQSAGLTNDVSLLRSALLQINDILQNDTMFSKISWFTRREYESGNTENGATSPVQ